MKTKLIVTFIIVTLTVSLYSFKNIKEKDTSTVALVMPFDGKKDADGYLILYGDGSTENVPFEIKHMSDENALMTAAMGAALMNKLHEKGYRYVGSHVTANSSPALSYPFMIFEKN